MEIALCPWLYKSFLTSVRPCVRYSLVSVMLPCLRTFTVPFPPPSLISFYFFLYLRLILYFPFFYTSSPFFTRFFYTRFFLRLCCFRNSCSKFRDSSYYSLLFMFFIPSSCALFICPYSPSSVRDGGADCGGVLEGGDMETQEGVNWFCSRSSVSV